MINLSKRTLAILLIAIIGIGTGIGIGVYFFFFNRENPPNEPPGAFTLSSDANDPDDDGTFTLTWGAADGAVNYSVYEYSSYITVINSSLITLSTSITSLSRALTGYSNGTYYFIVVAHNAQGGTLSNCHTVIVAIPPEEDQPPGAFTLSSDANDPDDDGTFTLTWGVADGVVNYSVYEYSSYITVINSSLTTLSTNIISLSRALLGYSNGTYFFIAVAHNAQGDTLSNCHTVIVAIPPEEPIWITPGVTGIPENQWIKIGMMGDIGEIQGDANYQGGYLAAYEINQAGGVEIDGTTYYVAIAKEDTNETASEISSSSAVAAAERMIYSHGCQFAVGGHETESLLAYREPFMANKIPFLSTGVMTDKFCEDVRNYYPRYKYYWRVSPFNSSYSSFTFVPSVLAMYSYLLAEYGPDDIDHVGILAENQTWTEGIRTVLDDYLNAVFGAGTVTPNSVIAFDLEVTPSVMDSHLQQLEDEGCDLVLIAISGEAGIVMSQVWEEHERPFLLFGSNIQAHTAGHWNRTNGACEYEIGYTTTVRCNKTEKTIPFYDAFYGMWNEHPLSIAVGAYDAVNFIVESINTAQSFDPDVLVAEMETWNRSNPQTGAGNQYAWWSGTHDLVGGYPYGYDVWFQWQNGVKILIPSLTPYLSQPPQYPDTLSPMGSVQIPDWITWDVGP
ncbi:MAG: ABC transporter substrate-binding protein [Promethearchaeota archaeon]